MPSRQHSAAAAGSESRSARAANGATMPATDRCPRAGSDTREQTVMRYGHLAGLALAALPVLLPAPAAATELPFERGDYLINGIVACGNCHTPQGPDGPLPGMELAGGLVIQEPEFTVVTPNITPDPATGIGRWSDEQIIAAIREGRRPDGSVIGPPMPVGLYRQMADRDAQALVALPAPGAAGAQRGAAHGVSLRLARELRPAGRRGRRGAARRSGRLGHLSRRRARPLHRVPHAAHRERHRLRPSPRRRRQSSFSGPGANRSRPTSPPTRRTASAPGPTPRSSARSPKASGGTAPR